MRLPYTVRSRVNTHKSRLPADWTSRDDWKQVNGEYVLPGYRILDDGAAGLVIAQVKNVAYSVAPNRA